MNQWRDCFRVLPYRDYRGRWVLFPLNTQQRQDMGVTQYREREETWDEWEARQW